MSLQSAINQTFQLAALASTQIGNISNVELDKAFTKHRLNAEADIKKFEDVEQLANDYAKKRIISKGEAETLKRRYSMGEEDRAEQLKIVEEDIEKNKEMSSTMSPLQKHRLAKSLSKRSPDYEDPVEAFYEATERDKDEYLRKQAIQSLRREQNSQRNTKGVKSVDPDKPSTGMVGFYYTDVNPRRKK